MKHTTTQLFAILLCTILPFNLYAQKAVSVSGNDAQGSGGSVAWSVGQMAYTTNEGTTHSSAQGVQQTFLVPMDYDISVYLFGLFDPLVLDPGPPLRTTLNEMDLLPLTQPFSGSPWNYAGTESVPDQASIPDEVADWVLLRFWTSPPEMSGLTPRLIRQNAGFVHGDGSVTTVDGGLPRLQMDLVDDYYIEVVHQNHLPVSTAFPQPVFPLGGTLLYDFTFDMAQAYSNPAQDDDPMVTMLSVNGTSFGMVSGNVQNADLQIDANDLNLLFGHYLEFLTYGSWDVNRDGQVDPNDINMLFFNYNRNGHRPY